MAVIINSMVFWVAVLCTAEKAQCFRGTSISRVQEKAKKPAEAAGNLCPLPPASTGFLLVLLFNAADRNYIFL
jgi:hypothetical protein